MPNARLAQMGTLMKVSTPSLTHGVPSGAVDRWSVGLNAGSRPEAAAVGSLDLNRRIRPKAVLRRSLACGFIWS